MHTSFPRVVAPYLPAYVAASLHHLHALYPTYVRYYLTDSVTVPNSSEGEPIELYKLITPLVDFVTGATRQSRARVSFDQGTLGKLVDALVQWCQMTKENVSWPPSFSGLPDHMRVQEEEWAADANLFISQEEDDTQAYSVRVAIFELLSVCGDQGHLSPLPELFCSSLFSQIPLLKLRPRYTLLSSVLLLKPTKLENLA